ncbi:AAA family ATPase [Ferrovibrio sp.]|uniref:AAA family ATPase n=1 Tax=Ferrovibrio sp. TaxID=1917215 RepID=UPI003D150D5E
MPLSAPFLKRLTLLPERIDRKIFPFNQLPWLQGDFQFSFTAPITILAGENGSGKSTLLEAIASLCGFSAYGGNQHHRLLHVGAPNPLREAFRAAWLPKVTHGFFFRAESFFNLADYVDREGDKDYWGGKRLQDQSHGESFLATFENKFKSRKPSIYILDEPEAALSPQRMKRFLRLMDSWQNGSHVQAIIATHSPIIMGLPGADLRLITPDGITPCRLRDVPHFREMQEFFADPESYYDAAVNTPLPD